jgi:hypothetical protein
MAPAAGNNQETWISLLVSFEKEKNKYCIVFSRYYITRRLSVDNSEKVIPVIPHQ